ncbi:MAG: hypothetical protein HY518_02770 [Candidatus Aenigmarchaeota archaeon]|nr:hypothetical protein [Candidatus Aenigmarchaeota archaeon]
MLKGEFDAAVDEWKAHCSGNKYSSSASVYMDCDAARRIAGMGPAALPLIREKYSGDDDDAFFAIAGWAAIVGAIVGDEFSVPAEIKGRVSTVRDYTIRWLDDNMGKYIRP